ncbi:DNA methyltransferase [Pseudomonas auratipiscis]|uniref:DNA methyltransferase n=1 Tax=Pseudomonas auratipiscis TaxID=3115853 RepID=A0AB35WQL9_9PSED|nr:MULTISPECIES: DNA methyltransferase [unclassified Pseudomonas]MEE1866996.1 DNA methyltransferase [Pseudomonas sp. 120P]MEE1957823.1 DNA methyltransferase [Pseudomonas sp. 119P]
MGLTQHGAGWPFAVPDFFIKFLTEPGDLVADIFSGRGMAGRAVEENQRRWICIESALQYVRGAAELFRSFQGYCINPALEEAFKSSHTSYPGRQTAARRGKHGGCLRGLHRRREAPGT